MSGAAHMADLQVRCLDQYNSTDMSILKVARMGHPVLRAKARPIERGQITSAAVQRLIDDMMETMLEYHGVGLAAPQIHEGLRLFVATLDAREEGSDAEPIAMINPEVTPITAEIVDDWEGCLSIPDIRGRVPRAMDIKVRAFDRDAKRIDMTVHGYNARVVQHETDHLDGILFFDRMQSFESLTFLDEYSRYWVKTED
jgi:peptide deformylase